MNDLTKENIKIALCNALADDKDLMQKEVAAHFGTDSASISNVKNPNGWKRVQQTLWVDMEEWRMSGKKLRGYVPSRLLNTPPETAPEPAPAPSIYDKLEAQHKKAVEKKEAKKKTEQQPEQKPELQPEPKPEPLPEKQPEQKEPSVSKGAKKLLKDRRECEQLSESIGKQIEEGESYISADKPESTRKLEEKRKERKKGKKLFNEKPEGKKPEPKADTKPEEKNEPDPKGRSEFDKAVNGLFNYILEEGEIIPIPIGVHKYTPEPNMISQKFDIEVEVRLSVKEKK